MIEIKEEHVSLLQKANAGTYAEKQDWFYPFKAALLKKHAAEDGYDLQIIKKTCWTCHGSGKANVCNSCSYNGGCDNCWHPSSIIGKEVSCPKCNGTGIYSRKEYWLKRYKIGNAIFHVPMSNEKAIANPELPNTFVGKIEHAPINQYEAKDCMLKLLFRFDTKLWMKYHKNKIYPKLHYLIQRYKWKIGSKWNEFKYKIRGMENMEPF